MIFVKKQQTKDQHLYLSTELCQKLNSDYIQIWIDDKHNKIAFLSCGKNDENAVKIYQRIDHTSFKQHYILTKQVSSLFDTYERVPGKYYKKDNCVIFNLKRRKKCLTKQ